VHSAAHGHKLIECDILRRMDPGASFRASTPPIDRSQRSKIRRLLAELATEVLPQRGRHDAYRIQQPTTHAQKANLQRQPNLSDGPRRASIRARSLAVNVKNASISKPLNSRGNC
jgi:hypothetical protein